MITKQTLEKEIDAVRDEYLEALYNIIRAFSLPIEDDRYIPKIGEFPGHITDAEDWQSFVQETYGCLADDPIERREQGDYEKREEVE